MKLSRAWVAPLLRRAIRTDVHGQLAGVWVRGPLPTGAAVLAPNHHSWWDGYLLAVLAWSLGQPFTLMMTPRQLRRFPFLRRIGAVDTGQTRELLRAVRAGGWAVIFPEAALQSAGPVRALHPGAAWLARASGAPLVPVALRVVLRGAQWPEAFVRFGPPCAPDHLHAVLTELLAALDADLLASDPDQPPAGYLKWLSGRASRHDRPSLASQALTLLDQLE
ncbi:lysophospholipid acyltransferase family protein [Deinococcus cavernae]|uniref:lysophospholipid acyltransferase family protein n=1 Tax=Deinococcus cavernae TaxID=2320857 RepID=UPI001F1680E3|nr:lysophospholipid acyltransferase family protein [Deinococcus cavernae]